MRIWSLHPKYLDSKGLVALWRETLLAQNVLRGNTKGYKNHPQLNRFKEQKNPVAAIGKYLDEIVKEAKARGYNFDVSKIADKKFTGKISVTDGQMDYEIKHLKKKLEKRDPERLKDMKKQSNFDPHPLFAVVKGKIEDWEIV